MFVALGVVKALWENFVRKTNYFLDTESLPVITNGLKFCMNYECMDPYDQ